MLHGCFKVDICWGMLYGVSVAGFLVFVFLIIVLFFLDGQGAFGEQCLNKYLPFPQSMLFLWRPFDSIRAASNDTGIWHWVGCEEP